MVNIVRGDWQWVYQCSLREYFGISPEAYKLHCSGFLQAQGGGDRDLWWHSSAGLQD